jgi:hypothetical protein
MPFHLGKRGEDDLILFHSAAIPTQDTHGHLYKAVIGPKLGQVTLHTMEKTIRTR